MPIPPIGSNDSLGSLNGVQELSLRGRTMEYEVGEEVEQQCEHEHG
jgi:hypothetical protein